ncbi:MAG: hypothetical protein AAF380_01005 [Bacteroidota bacterium]
MKKIQAILTVIASFSVVHSAQAPQSHTLQINVAVYDHDIRSQTSKYTLLKRLATQQRTDIKFSLMQKTYRGHTSSTPMQLLEKINQDLLTHRGYQIAHIHTLFIVEKKQDIFDGLFVTQKGLEEAKANPVFWKNGYHSVAIAPLLQSEENNKHKLNQPFSTSRYQINQSTLYIGATLVNLGTLISAMMPKAIG